MTNPTSSATQSSLRQIVQPFIDLAHSPRALWGINLGYLIEGLVYFGMLNYLVMYFNEYVRLDDIDAARMVGLQTAGITVAMFFFGGLSDKLGVRRSLLLAFLLMIAGRVFLSSAPYLNLPAGSLTSATNLTAVLGILFVVLGYGMYQPAAYAGVRQFTSEKTAGMAYAMLYALMNLGAWIPTFAYMIREDQWLGAGIAGTFWVFTALTLVSLVATAVILSTRTVNEAARRAKAERAEVKALRLSEDDALSAGGADTATPGARDARVFAGHPARRVQRVIRWIREHPLMDPRFTFFIFALVPVQTLFAHNWLTLPLYVERGFRGTWPWLSRNFEPAVNLNPLLIFIIVPIVTALTQRRNVYSMMILGTLVMALPTFLLALGPRPWTLISYLVLMTVGEAMWQPRFLQYAAEIAPEGRTGAYMGVAQFPWFLTKMIVPLYSGWFLREYCPSEGRLRTEEMWLIYACIAMASTILLVIARPWMMRNFRTRSA